jgi:hypothetical protein
VIVVSGDDELANPILRSHVRDGPQQRKAAALTIDGVLACREGRVAATAATAFPDGEADQLQAVELSVDEMQLGIREFAGRVPVWSVMVAGESSSTGAVVTNAKYIRVWRPIVTVTLGVIDS